MKPIGNKNNDMTQERFDELNARLFELQMDEAATGKKHSVEIAKIQKELLRYE